MSKLVKKAKVRSKPVIERNKAEADRAKAKLIAADIQRRINNKRDCPHQRPDGKSSISWHEHSNGIILGVCTICLSQFDARNKSDSALLQKNRKAQINMGRAGQHARKGVIVILPVTPFTPEDNEKALALPATTEKVYSEAELYKMPLGQLKELADRDRLKAQRK